MKKIFSFLLSIQSKSLLLYQSFDTLIKITEKKNPHSDSLNLPVFQCDTIGVIVLRLSERKRRVWNAPLWAGKLEVNKPGERGWMSIQKFKQFRLNNRS